MRSLCSTRKILRFLALQFVLGVVLAATENITFPEFTEQFKKNYRSLNEYAQRRAIFENNLKKMIQHNNRYEAGEVSWWMKVSEDMDLTHEEWVAKRIGGRPAFDNTTNFKNTLDNSILDKISELGSNPKELNWVTRGKVSSVKRQGYCGSCSAFAAIGAVESCFKIQHRDAVDDLSEQHILDCAYNHIAETEYGSFSAYGCDGAFAVTYLDWLIEGHYNQEEASYKYTSGNTGQITSCSPDQNGYHKKARVTGMHLKWYEDESEMESLIQINPVITAVDASYWDGYGGGVFDDPACCNAASDSNCVRTLNHDILVVGYGHDSHSGLDYWLIKNSWGTGWGDGGFLKLKRGTGHCGVGIEQTIPLCD